MIEESQDIIDSLLSIKLILLIITKPFKSLFITY